VYFDHGIVLVYNNIDLDENTSTWVIWTPDVMSHN
jgi:hypothetical protein